MAISEAQVKLVRFPPELIPDSFFGNVPAGSEIATPVLDIRRFNPYLVSLENIQLTANALVELRARYDSQRVYENTAAMLSVQPGAWRLIARDLMYLNFFGVGGVANYTTHYGLWAYLPTLAHKLLYGIKLSSDEQVIAEELGIAATVEKGLLPLPIREQIEREYPIVVEETHSRSVNIAVAATPYQVEDIFPRPGEIVVLTRIAAAPGAAAQNVRFIIDRDDDTAFRDIPTFPLSLVVGGEINCFIPAIKELRITTNSTVAPGAHLFRYTFQRIKLNNILRVRFGLVSKDEVPLDLWKKVQAGVL